MNKANKATLKYFVFVIILGFIVTATGCATVVRPALEKKTKSLDISQNSIVLMSGRTFNFVNPGNSMRINIIRLRETGDGKEYVVAVNEPINSEFFKTQDFWDHLINFQLPPGKYKIYYIQGEGKFYGSYYVNCDNEFELNPNKIIYLGHVKIINRKQEEGEPRSGSLIPLFDQGWGGFSVGTIDLTISDNYNEDIAIFKQHYPVLENYVVEKNILELPEKDNNERAP